MNLGKLLSRPELGVLVAVGGIFVFFAFVAGEGWETKGEYGGAGRQVAGRRGAFLGMACGR